ncbi:hypothetical protein OZ411_36255 [Bradyrhizobium sp. Arg237L]|uniref:hypothetical protein n=1 Tax=Bradyrhizobium sp. Arg237L TaxID=3003352 RepID=UPI00249ECCEE|nr:hypothetical protein [Bradyrhizobium sp. Arg237L]MDI4238268.1 hypothetical protein [Bradyrhizobium sp. Arg237L]
MIRSMISVISIAVVIVIGTLFWRPHSHSIELTATAMPPLAQLHAMAGVEKLRAQEIDDQSLVYPTPTK